MADLNASSLDRLYLVGAIHRMGERTGAAAERILDDLDTLLAENARLRAAEAEMDRLRGLCREAADHLDPSRWALAADDLAANRSRARATLVARLDRAALGEP